MDVSGESTKTGRVMISRSPPPFAGIDNELYYMDNPMLPFGDAKSFVGELVKELTGDRVGA